MSTSPILPKYNISLNSYTHNPYKSKSCLRKLCSCRPERFLKTMAQLVILAVFISLFLTLIGICSLPGGNTLNQLYPAAVNKDIKQAIKRHLDPSEDDVEFTTLENPHSAESILKVINAQKLHKEIEEIKYENERPIMHPVDDQPGHLAPGDKNSNSNSPSQPQDILQQLPKIINPKNLQNQQDFEDYVANQEKILNEASNILVEANKVKLAEMAQAKLKEDSKNGDPTNNGVNKFLSELKFDGQPYDRSLGTPKDPSILEKRNFIKEMTKHAWDGYEKYAWTYNELRPITKKGHSQSIFGDAKTGATIIDAMDTLYLMGFDDEFERAKNWLRDEFKFNSKTDVSVFETNIRFIGGLVSLYYLTGDKIFSQKAKEIAEILLPAFNTKTKLPYALYNPATGKMKNYKWANAGCSILSEMGTLHLEFGSLTHITHDSQFLNIVMDIRNYLNKMERPESRIWYNFINPQNGAWGSSKAASVGALGDSFYEYLLKTYLITGKNDTVSLEMYLDSLVGIKDLFLRYGVIS